MVSNLTLCKASDGWFAPHCLQQLLENEATIKAIAENAAAGRMDAVAQCACPPGPAPRSHVFTIPLRSESGFIHAHQILAGLPYSLPSPCLIEAKPLLRQLVPKEVIARRKSADSGLTFCCICLAESKILFS